MISKTQNQNNNIIEPKKPIKGIGKPEYKPRDYSKELKVKTFKEYLHNYSSNGYYYKAYTTQYLRENSEPILKEFNLNVSIFTSYNTEVFIYDYLNEIIIFNREYYNCSRTTKEQIEFKINNSFYKFAKDKYYLTNENFKLLTDAIKKEQARKYYGYLDTIKLRAEYERKAIKEYNAAKARGTYLINKQINKPETITKLKTRNRHKEIFNIYNVKFIQEYSTNKKNTRIISKVKIKLHPETQFYTMDIRKYNDKILYSGQDIGISNTKNLKRNYINTGYRL